VSPARARALLRPCAAVALACLFAGCQGRGPAGGSSSPPAAPRELRIAVVDFTRAARAHPRWSELQALDRRLADLQAQLAVPVSAQFQPPRIDLAPEFRAEAQRQVDQMRPEFRKEFEQQASAMQDAARREVEAYAAKVHADEQVRFDQKRAELETAARKAIVDKQAEIMKDNEQFDRQTLEQYRLQLLNLRLKLDTVGQTDKQAAATVSAQIEATTKERDDKIAAHTQANQQALQTFQQQQAQQFNAAVTELQHEISKEGQTLLNQKAAEVNARLHTQVEAKQAEINVQLNTRLKTQLKAREQVLVSGARAQITRAREQATAAIRARLQAQQAQLQAARDERGRLLATILADLRVEAAALAQQKGYDVILTQAVATVDAVDATDDLIARLKR